MLDPGTQRSTVPGVPLVMDHGEFSELPSQLIENRTGAVAAAIIHGNEFARILNMTKNGTDLAHASFSAVLFVVHGNDDAETPQAPVPRPYHGGYRSNTCQMSQKRLSKRTSSPRLSSRLEVEKNINLRSSVSDMKPLA